MTLEKKLIEKTYYEGYLQDRDESPIEVLGQLYIAEQRKNVPDLTSIRFAQGELYFQYHDYEAAIFKWENISNELEPWAKKNLADAYLELEEYSTAESFYKSVVTDSELLQTEISLQLFSLYFQKGNHEMALGIINNLVLTNPDYANIPTIAKSYYEEQQNWEKAVELAVKEGKRTDGLKWYEALIHYSNLGVIQQFEPAYFIESLKNLQELDFATFERLSISLWKNYEDTAYYLTWVTVFNSIYEPVPCEGEEGLAHILEGAYALLIDGSYSIKEVEEIVPALLSNYFLSSIGQQTVSAASAVLAWNEMFKHSMDQSVVSKAEMVINETTETNISFQQFMNLFESIIEWADKHDIPLDKKFAQKVHDFLPSNHYQLLMVGSVGSGVNAYINELVGETVLAEDTNAILTIKDNDYLEINEVTNSGLKLIDTLTNFYEELLVQQESPRVFQLDTPSHYLNQNRWTVTTAPFVEDASYADYAMLADSLLFVINEQSVFSYTEYEQLKQWKEKSPFLTLQFLIYIDDLDNEKVASKRLQKAMSAIQHYFPDSKIFIYSKQEEREAQLDEISRYYYHHFAARKMNEERLQSCISIIQDLITNLLDKRLDMEDSLKASLQLYEEMVSKLTGAKNQLIDMEASKSELITKQFDEIKIETQEAIKKEIPAILKGCKDIIKEDSDYSKMHISLNKEMNKRVNEYLNETLSPKIHRSIEEWIQAAHKQLEDGQLFLNELSKGFNGIYKEHPIELSCDFVIIEDWKRDARRLSSGLRIEPLNIFNRFNASQVFLKSAGKLLGAIQQNNKMLQSRYQKYLETEDFSDVAASVSTAVLQHFDFYEKGLENDIKMFFVRPKRTLEQIAEEKSKDIVEYKNLLDRLKNNPELFHDPLKLFELRLLQYDWLANTTKPATTWT
ncbi:tetratricopeptide (TPR) repeat family protein [Niallia circulans]|jgi:hypothetical protein|uniref:GTP-binding protein n=1 Tax=Niallia circulans TaxID=1397 RepID=A0A0J1ILC1_NIACI|nr:hypothetical protein [Niallia circulans]KLV26802.1 hypothetical protein ABW02_09675 [Niallia circulans]MDR4317158.1 GTP-binding protein [Niallia circulans]MED3838139.1 GTP-binding protein [Niallia circulans]MED4241531.1 GTP-binding protein [Niallia circulans]MED4247163.1 GTP-binding protein [Niallia circulans]